MACNAVVDDDDDMGAIDVFFTLPHTMPLSESKLSKRNKQRALHTFMYSTYVCCVPTKNYTHLIDALTGAVYVCVC